jgi:hypothetical protein
MAENIDNVQQQLADAMRRAQEDYARYGQLQSTTSEQLFNAQMKQKLGSENATKGLNAAGQALGALAGAGIESTKAMYQGKKGMGAFNSSLDELSKAATLAGTALTLLMPGGIIMKAIVGAFTLAAGAAIAYVKAANEMSDKLYKGYEGLQKSGAAASDGMTGVYRDAKKLGLSMDELDSMVSLVAESSNDLVLFGGTVADGRRKLADLAQASETSREGFFKLGISQQAQNEAMVGYMRLQARSGNAEKQTTDQLAASARNYITEQDQLARITGMNVKDQQKAREAALMEEQFLAKVRQLQREGKHAEAKELQDANIMMSAMGDEVGKGFRAMANGNLRDENARKFMMSTQGAGLDAVQKITTGQIKAADAAQMVSQGFQGYLDAQGDQLATLGVAGDSATNYAQVVKGAAMGQADYQKQLEKAQADQANTLAGKGDPLADAQGRMIKVQQDINKKLEDDVFKGIPNAQKAMGKLANVTDGLADVFTKLTNAIVGVLNFFGLGEKKPEPPKQMTQAGAALAEQTTQARDQAKPLQKRVDELDAQIKADEKKLLEQKKLGKYGAEEVALEAKIKRSTEEREKVATELVDQEKKIATLARMESQLRHKQTQDRQALARLEGANLRDMEKVKELNVEKIEAEKKGDRAGAQKAQGKINQLNTDIQDRAPKIQTMQAELKTSAVGGAGANAKPEDVLEFSGASGGRENFDGLGADMKGALLSAGQQYFEQTGQKLKMNSGFRSPEDQLRLYNETKDAKRPGKGPTGMPVAQPGSSPHETGMAVDIQNYTDPKAVAALNSAGLRQTVPKDPVHFQLQAADGGVFSGPDSGYPAALHGEEAVIPLNNGGGNFVKVFEDMAMMIGQQVGAMDELIRIAKNSNDIQTKILRSQA